MVFINLRAFQIASDRTYKGQTYKSEWPLEWATLPINIDVPKC